MLGNVREWTTENSNFSEYGVYRGGCYGTSRDFASTRLIAGITDASSYGGFRITLYVK